MCGGRAPPTTCGPGQRSHASAQGQGIGNTGVKNPARVFQFTGPLNSGRMSAAFEKHYRVKELADLWGFCDNTIIKLFADEPGVLRLERLTAKRKYLTLSIPESIALRVHERLGHKPLQSTLAASNPLRVVRLRDLNTGVAQKPRNVIKLKAA